MAGPEEGGLRMGFIALSLPMLRQTVLPGSFGSGRVPPIEVGRRQPWGVSDFCKPFYKL